MKPRRPVLPQCRADIPAVRVGRRVFRDPSRAAVCALFNLSNYRVNRRGCHVWQGALNGGYAAVGTNKLGAFRASRLVYIRDVGRIPRGAQLDHLCRNTRCVNAAHLEPVSNAENTRRGKRTRLNWEKVRAIRRRVRTKTYRAVAAEFGVPNSLVSNIVNRKRWAAR